MALSSKDEGIHWCCPASPLNVLRQLWTNVPLTILRCLMGIGEFVWNKIIKIVFTCPRVRFQRPHQAIEAGTYERNYRNTLALKDKGGLPSSQAGGVRKHLGQTESVLYSKLPVEIRTLVFEMALFGHGNVVHVYKRRKKLAHLRCNNQFNGQPCTWAAPCSPALPYTPIFNHQVGLIPSDQNLTRFYDPSRFHHSPTWSIVSLMRTCHRIYCDVAPMLYQNVHFHFPHPTDLALFSSRVKKEMLDSIRIMSFDVGDFDSGFAIEATDEVSEGTSTVSSGLKGLKELRVFVKKRITEVRTQEATFPGGPPNTASIGGLLLGCNIKEREGFNVFQVVVPGQQYRVWEGLLCDKRGVDLSVYRDDSVPPEIDER